MKKTDRSLCDPSENLKKGSYRELIFRKSTPESSGESCRMCPADEASSDKRRVCLPAELSEASSMDFSLDFSSERGRKMVLLPIQQTTLVT